MARTVYGCFTGIVVCDLILDKGESVRLGD